MSTNEDNVLSNSENVTTTTCDEMTENTENSNDIAINVQQNYPLDNAIDLSTNISNTKQKKKHVITVLPFTILSLIVVVSIAMIVVLFIKNNSLNQQLSAVQHANKELEKKLESVDEDFKKLKTADAELSNKDDLIINELAFTNIGIYMSGAGIVTDKAYVEKATLYQVAGALRGNFDISPQPYYDDYFLGQGRINLSDREIKAMIEELVYDIADAIDNYGLGDSFNVNNCQFYFTHNNYEIASYVDGVIRLAGEY